MSFYMCARVRVCAPACPPARLPACPPARLPACPPARPRQYGLDCSESPAEHRFGVVAIDDSERRVGGRGGPFLCEVGSPAPRLPGSPAPRLPGSPAPRLPGSPAPPKNEKARSAIAPRARPENQYLSLKKEHHKNASAATCED